jgi:glutathionyl-hydroquinone reductase
MAAKHDQVHPIGFGDDWRQVNNGVYKSGFATTQQAYDRAQAELYRALDDLEGRLANSRFLLGDRWGTALSLLVLRGHASAPCFPGKY